MPLPPRLRGGSSSFELLFLQSALTPASLTTLAQRAFSLTMKAPRASGVPARTSVPCFARNSFMSTVFRIRVSSPFSFATISRGEAERRADPDPEYCRHEGVPRETGNRGARRHAGSSGRFHRQRESALGQSGQGSRRQSRLKKKELER